MEEKGKNITTDNLSTKLEWEAPHLISLDKGKTEGGDTRDPAGEDSTYLS